MCQSFLVRHLDMIDFLVEDSTSTPACVLLELKRDLKPRLYLFLFVHMFIAWFEVLKLYIVTLLIIDYLAEADCAVHSDYWKPGPTWLSHWLLEPHCTVEHQAKIYWHIRSGLEPTVPAFDSCTNWLESPNMIHDRTPDFHPVSWPWMHGWPHNKT